MNDRLSKVARPCRHREREVRTWAGQLHSVNQNKAFLVHDQRLSDNARRTRVYHPTAVSDCHSFNELSCEHVEPKGSSLLHLLGLPG